MVIANIEKPVAFQPEWLMNLEIQTNRSHAIYLIRVVTIYISD